MSSFTEKLVYEPLGTYRNGRPEYRLTKPFYYLLDNPVVGTQVIFVPEGFVTDFASIPSYFRWLFKPDGKYVKAAVIHDFLYEQGHLLRTHADSIFLEAMKVSRVPMIVRYPLYAAVRLFGWRSFGSVIRGK